MDIVLNALKSKTIWGIVIAALGQTAIGSDVILTFGVTEDIAAVLVGDIVTWIGLALGVYGRAVAKAPLVKADA